MVARRHCALMCVKNGAVWEGAVFTIIIIDWRSSLEKRLRYGLGDAGFKSQQGQEILGCPKLSIQALGSTHPLSSE
jgi:hypothetical protein